MVPHLDTPTGSKTCSAALSSTSAVRRKQHGKGKQSSVDQGKETVWEKAFSFYSEDPVEWEKDEACEFLHWLKTIVSLFVGLVFGLLSIEGVVGIIMYVAVLGIITYVWTNSVSIDENVLELSELMQEATMPGVMGFVVRMRRNGCLTV
eukprot:GHVQ01031912.1.p1 GENE.GHVQ01031912.1~~GHVQ01031912.1.p1  ORF type:complete len:149 (+),score=25.46 GHVQ01031912.1:835-1281(+)